MKKKNPQDIGKGLIIVASLVFVACVDGYACEKFYGGIYDTFNESYQCDDGHYFDVKYSKDHKDAYLYDEYYRKIIHMGRVPSKSGEKYTYTHKWANQETLNIFWKKGKKAVIEIGKDKYNNCQIERELIIKDGQNLFICYDRNGKKVDCTKK